MRSEHDDVFGSRRTEKMFHGDESLIKFKIGSLRFKGVLKTLMLPLQHL